MVHTGNQSNVVHGLLPLLLLDVDSIGLLLVFAFCKQNCVLVAPALPLIFVWPSFKLNLSRPYWRNSSTSSSHLMPIEPFEWFDGSCGLYNGYTGLLNACGRLADAVFGNEWIAGWGGIFGGGKFLAFWFSGSKSSNSNDVLESSSIKFGDWSGSSCLMWWNWICG